MNNFFKIERMKQLIQLLNDWTNKYDAGYPVVSDIEWDKNYFELKALEEETGICLMGSPTQNIHYEFKTSLTKVKHNHPMLSLDKTKDWQEFIEYFENKDVVGMPKLDGLTVSLVYENGKIISAETRGDGEIGEDVTHNILTVQGVPYIIPYKERLIIDGEIICTDKDFEPFKEEYKNNRNFASGSIRLLNANECRKRKLTFVVWNVVEGLESTVIKNFTTLKKLGFTVPPWTSSFDWDARDFLVNSCKELGYPIDGLVGRFNDIEYGTSLGSTSHHARAAYAFKFSDAEVDTELLDIEWGMGRTGVLTPVAIFEPVELEGTTVSRASLHNISVMNSLWKDNWYKGLTVTVFKSNQIIPQISKVTKEEEKKLIKLEMPKLCPECGGETKVVTSESGVKQLICTNPACQAKLINQLDHFCGKKGMDIKGLSKATLEKLINWGWVNKITDIYSLNKYKKEWIDKEGFGEKSVTNILQAIENSKICKLENFISALGIPLIGKTVAKEIVKYFATWDDFISAVGDGQWSALDGFGPEMEKALNSFDFSIAKEVEPYLTFEKIVIKNEDITLKGLTFCVTGKLKEFKNRDAIKSYIEDLGGKVTGSVSGNTNYLINNDINSTSAKNKTAQKLGIPIITEEQLKKMIDN
jgi:DNA ligase (NAD+)